jgi:two-component system response regulator PhoP
MRILVIEDDIALRALIRRHFEKLDYVVDETGDGMEGFYFTTEYPLDLAIIDIGLPRMSGLELVKKLRAQGSTLPVLMLTARGRWQERVEGLEGGADDYLVKPFQMEELTARVKALIRRVNHAPLAQIDFGYLVINLETQRVVLEGEEIGLTTFEYRVLEYLAKHKGKIVSKDDLRAYLYSHEEDPESNVLTVLVGRLRKKLDPNGSRSLIETLHGRGYRLS